MTTGKETPEHADDVAAIDAIREGLANATARGDVNAAMSLFTEDAIYMRPGEPDDVGREAIGEHWSERLNEMNIRLAYGANETVVSGSLAYAQGVVEFRGRPRGGGEKVVLSNRYVWILRRGDDDVWRIARYIRNFRE